jgi:hypothetical protein
VFCPEAGTLRTVKTTFYLDGFQLSRICALPRRAACGEGRHQPQEIFWKLLLAARTHVRAHARTYARTRRGQKTAFVVKDFFFI